MAAILISLNLKVNLDRKVGVTPASDEHEKKEMKKENRKAIKELFNWPILIFFGILFHGGAIYGVIDTYLFIYLQSGIFLWCGLGK